MILATAIRPKRLSVNQSGKSLKMFFPHSIPNHGLLSDNPKHWISDVVITLNTFPMFTSSFTTTIPFSHSFLNLRIELIKIVNTYVCSMSVDLSITKISTILTLKVVCIKVVSIIH